MELDEDQIKIVNHTTGHAAVYAGAGAGKTATIVQRAIKRMQDGLDPDNILILTFTNKACKEIIERIKDADQGLPIVNTFHSFGFEFIRNHSSEVGLAPYPSIIDAKDANSLLREMFLEYRLMKEDLKIAFKTVGLLAREGWIDLYTESEYMKAIRFIVQKGFDLDFANKIVEAYKTYSEVKQSDNVLDYDDLINLPIKSLVYDNDLKEHYRERFVDVTVDECQDTNQGQYGLLHLIANKTILLTGDNSQALYRFRGAKPSNLQNFIKSCNPTIYYLLRNYRSQKIIVDSAAQLISNNENAQDRNQYSARLDQNFEKITYMSHDRETCMADKIALQIGNDLDEGLSPSEIAILYRTNRMGKTIEPALVNLAIPYNIKRGTELLERAEVKMVIAIGRLVVNPRDILALTRFSALIPGLGKKGIKNIAASSRSSETAIWDNIDTLTCKAQETLLNIRSSIESLKYVGPKGLFDWALKETVFKNWLIKEALNVAKLRGETNIEAAADAILEAKIVNLTHLKSAIQIRLGDCISTNAEDQWAEVIMDLLPKPPDESGKEGCVTLATIHSSKGLQWKKVYIAGFSDGLMPFKNRKTGMIDNLTEERCLMYVAMTRAMDSLSLHHFDSAVVNGKIKEFVPSRFMREFATNENISILN